MKIYIDGQILDKENAKVSVFDHGLLYGDGIFEGIRFYNRRVFRFEEHLDRLFDSAQAICLKPIWSRDVIRSATLDLIRRNGLSDGYVRLVITRGVGDLGLSPNKCPKPSLIIIASKIALYPQEMYDNGLEMITCATRRVAHGAFSPMVKSLNYLNNIMAKIEALNANAGEGLMLNEEGYVAECTGDNLFIVKKGKIFTPPIAAGALSGITRAVVFELAATLGYSLTEPNLTRYDVFTADECFLTGTAAEIIPAIKLDNRVIGEGRPGPITRELISHYRDLTGSTGTAID